MYWAGDDVLPATYGCPCNGACASCASASRGEYGVIQIAAPIVAAIISGAALLATTGVGIAASAAAAKRQREHEKQQLAAAQKQEIALSNLADKLARDTAKQQEAAALQVATETTAQTQIAAEASAAKMKTIMIGAAALAAIYYTMKD